MKIEDLKPGVYRLARDVTNPKPDRRTRDGHYIEDWARWTTIPKGMRFRVVDRIERFRVIAEEMSPERIAAITPQERYVIENYKGGGITKSFRDYVDHAWAKNQGERYRGENLFDLMVAALEPAPTTLDVWFTDRGFDLREDASELIAAMVRHRIIVAADLEAGLLATKADRAIVEERGERLPLPMMGEATE